MVGSCRRCCSRRCRCRSSLRCSTLPPLLPPLDHRCCFRGLRCFRRWTRRCCCRSRRRCRCRSRRRCRCCCYRPRSCRSRSTRRCCWRSLRRHRCRRALPRCPVLSDAHAPRKNPAAAKTAKADAVRMTFPPSAPYFKARTSPSCRGAHAIPRAYITPYPSHPDRADHPPIDGIRSGASHHVCTMTRARRSPSRSRTAATRVAISSALASKCTRTSVGPRCSTSASATRAASSPLAVPTQVRGEGITERSEVRRRCLVAISRVLHGHRRFPSQHEIRERLPHPTRDRRRQDGAQRIDHPGRRAKRPEPLGVHREGHVVPLDGAVTRLPARHPRRQRQRPVRQRIAHAHVGVSVEPFHRRPPQLLGRPLAHLRIWACAGCSSSPSSGSPFTRTLRVSPLAIAAAMPAAPCTSA